MFKSFYEKKNVIQTLHLYHKTDEIMVIPIGFTGIWNRHFQIRSRFFYMEVEYDVLEEYQQHVADFCLGKIRYPKRSEL